MRRLIALCLALHCMTLAGCISCDSPPPTPAKQSPAPTKPATRDRATMESDAETLIARMRALVPAPPEEDAFYARFGGPLDTTALRAMGFSESEIASFGYLCIEAELVLARGSISITVPPQRGQGGWSISRPLS